jgi:membrane protein DedA with SNARE-associated domain
MQHSTTLLIALGIALASFVSEDGATLLAAGLAVQNAIDPRIALLSAFLGVWIGDLGLYALARGAGARVLRWPWLQRVFSDYRRARAQHWAARNGAVALGISRFLPGTRFIAFTGAGLIGFPAGSFAAITGVTAALWVALVYLALRLIATHVLPFGEGASPLVVASVLALGMASVLAVIRLMLLPVVKRAALLLRKYRQWEFWPAWLFYPPVALMCARLGWKYGGLALPTVANPAFRNGGIVGESKAQALALLQAVAPGATAESWLIPTDELWKRVRYWERLVVENRLEYPFVMKPDVGQRGAGFRVIRRCTEARAYLKKVKAPVVLQRYVPGPHEAGIFYYRYPGAERGEIFGITEKVFPRLAGDGVHTFEQLLARDARMSLIAETYVARFPRLRGRVLPAGHEVRLVEAGNHCQGCVFLDGWHLYSEELRARLDEISQQIPGFFIGRYDIRFVDEDGLRAGRGFHIIELNGAASEATDVYDPRNSLPAAYRKLYRQWELVYRIGAMNRARGERPASAVAVFRDWVTYQRMALSYPRAD